MKQRIAYATLVALCGLAAPAALHAQTMQPYGGFYPGMFGALPPHEIVAIVRSKGLEPLSRPMRQGGAYTLRAADSAGRVVQVTVDARMGRVVRVAPAARTEAMPPPATPYPPPPGAPAPYPVPPAADRALPDVSPGNARILGTVPYPDDDFEPIGQTAPTGATPAAGPHAVARAVPPPPLPRPRPKIEGTSVPAASASADSTPAFTELEE